MSESTEAMFKDNSFEIDLTTPPATEKRRAGRPTAGSSRVGRDYLITKTREYMRVTPFSGVRRKDIAEFANISPSLVSYYFADKSSLVHAAAAPIVTDYSMEVGQIISNDSNLLDTLKVLIFKFIEFNFNTGYMLDYYLHEVSIGVDRGEKSLIVEQHAIINSFVEAISRHTAHHLLNPGFLQSSLWGSCRYLAHQPHLRQLKMQPEIDRNLQLLADATFELFTRGILGNVLVFD